MKVYNTKDIRNIAILGHQGSGKTSIGEALLYVSKAIDKKGEVEKKNTISDYLLEEQTKQTSMSLSVLPLEWRNHKLNFIDTAGSDEFVGDLNQSLNVVKGTVVLIDALRGIEVGTERVWAEVRKRHIPTVLFVNKMEKENVKFDKLFDEIKAELGSSVVPFSLPIGEGEDFKGYVDIINSKAYLCDNGKCTEGEIPGDYASKAEELRTEILESVAETSEELLELYLSGEEIPADQLIKGLSQGIVDGDIIPLIVGSALNNTGVDNLLNILVDYLPSPIDLSPLKGFDPKNNEEISRVTSSEEPFSAYVFKTTVDQFLGTINIIKINSGVLRTGQEVVITNKGENKKLMNLFGLRGKNQITLDSYNAGDICAVAKVDGLETGDTIADPRAQIVYPKVEAPTPIIYIAVHPKNKADEDKISMALNRINLEDPTFEIRRNKETAQLLLGGQGMTHLSYVLERMKTIFKVDVDIEDQKIVYRETIKRRVEAEGKHRKQSGGAGQFGHVYIRFEPTDEDFIFAEEIFGGSVPKNYHPAVEKGLIDTFEHGPLAGFPVINVKATLYDGSYHSVDSNEISFRMAASLAFREAVKTASPTILEPIVKVEVTVKDQFVGDVMGDMNKRRGRVLGMNQEGGFQVVVAEVPEAEIVKYAIDLKAMTQGSGSFTREFLRYEEVPHNLIDKIVEEYKK